MNTQHSGGARKSSFLNSSFFWQLPLISNNDTKLLHLGSDKLLVVNNTIEYNINYYNAGLRVAIDWCTTDIDRNIIR